MARQADFMSLSVKLDLQTAQFQKGMDQANKQIDRMERGFKKTSNVIKSFAGGLAAAFSVRAIVEFGKATLAAADNMSKLADATGLSVEEFQRLSHAAELGGVSTQQFESNMIAFTKRVGEAQNGMGPLVSGLKGWNDELLENIKNAKSQREAFDFVADAIAQAGSAAEKAAIANAAFSRSGVTMVNVTKDGSKAIRELTSELSVLSDENARVAAQINDQWNTVWRNFKVGAQNMLLDFIHALNVMGKASADFTNSELNKEISDQRKLVSEMESNVSRYEKLTGKVGAANPSTSKLAVLRAELEDLQILQTENKAFEFQSEGIFRIGESASSTTEEIKSLSKAIGGGSRSGGGGRSKNSLASSIDDATKAAEDFDKELKAIQEEQDSLVKSFSGGLANSIVDSFTEGTQSMQDFFTDFMKRIAAAIIQQQIFNALQGTSFGGVLSSIFGGARALGGPVAAGGAYLVGERGPELFTPIAAGNITPNNQITSSPTINQSFSFSGGGDSASQLRAEASRIKSETLIAVEQSIRRGGSLARSVGRKR